MKLCLLLLFASTNIFGQQILTGKVIDFTLKTPIKGAKVYLNIEDYTNADSMMDITEQGDVILAPWPQFIRTDSMISNSSGQFSFRVQQGIKYCVEAILIVDSFWIHDSRRHWSVVENINVKVSLKLRVYCEYTQYKDRDSCPVCNLKDQCIPTSFGLLIPDSRDLEDYFDEKKRKFYHMGCVRSRCEPRWYCKRCEKLF